MALIGTYLLFFGVFFWQVRGGFGQYWDWSFPYFSDQIHNMFANKDSSWIAAGSGSPMNYASDYFFRFVVSLFFFLPPELLHYLLLVVLFAVGAFGMYKLVRPHTTRWMAFLIGLLTWINPAIFYKYTAGHLNYFLSFALFIFFIHFLLHHFRRDLRSSVIAGLFFAFLGTQIQFFIIGGIFLIAFLLFNREKVALKYLAVLFGLPLLINLVWLTNFITGAVNTAETGAQAAKVSFKSSSASNFLSIFTFSFSKATLLSRFYAFYELLWNTSLFVFLLWLLSRGRAAARKRERTDLLLLVSLVIMMFMATGLYQVLNIYPLSVFYPMLREVGHFAPVIVLLALLLIARMVEQTRWRWGLLLVAIGSLFIVGVKFQYFSQKVDFKDARAAFAPFKQVADKDTGNYRILAYPFFDKYVLKDEPVDPPGDLPLKNSGHDSFAAFASQAFVQNAVAPYKFQESVQYQLLQSYNIDVLRPLGVKYIFDFSDIYESNYNLYVPAATYNNDLSLIKNDPHFFDKLIAHNPGRLRKVNNHVLEITDPLPRAAVLPRVFATDEDAPVAGTQLFTRKQLNQAFDYETDNSLAKYATHVSQLFASPKSSTLNKDKGTFSQKLDTSNGATLYANQSYRDITYEAGNNTVTLYGQTSPPLNVNGETLGQAGAPRQVVGTAPIAKGTTYYLSFGGNITRVRSGESGRLGSGKAGEKITILRADGSNLISNSSFEHNLWESRVGDCNNYDGNGALSMKRDATTATDGTSSLLLSATRHDACTSAQVKMAANTQYLVSFDYQSANASTASYFLSIKGQSVPLAKGSRAIVDRDWHTTSALVNTAGQSGVARLFLYALEGDGRTATINRYDDVTVVKLAPVQDITIPSGGDTYAKTELPNGEQEFTFADPNYHYSNLIANGSFEKGAWQPKVGDCNAYDTFPKLSMDIDKQDKSQGQQSLRLTASHHDACAHTTANVHEDTDYLLSFSYKATGTKTYGYTTSFDNPGATLSRNQSEAGKPGWHTVQTVVHVPAGASTLTLYLYAFESNGHAPNSVNYDNVNLTELPDFTDRFFVVQQPTEKLGQPKVSKIASPTQSVRTMEVQGAKSPFFVALSESYHPRWRLELNAGSTLLPGGSGAVTAGTRHTTLSNTVNGWLVDPQKLCTAPGGKVRTGCTKAADGSYTILLRAEFVPARWFGIGAAISWVAVLGSVAYLLVVRPKDVPTYTDTKRRRA
ncbi:MAG TPA: hypothetical protein VLF62_04810 [Candidatus Saccharimonadales bacterium]|nr:hypothetical protein [Candidatus Saccharimonadales bacterium]